MKARGPLRGHGFDIRVYKHGLRERYKARRASMDTQERAEKDAAILTRLTAMREYASCHTLLCYVSTPREIDTRALIERALAEGKRVAVPCCVKGSRQMDFYLIDSLEELHPGTFGVLEPKPETARKLLDFSDSLCVLPGLSFDLSGYRLGYGGGYYDRFLSRYNGATVGVCYDECMRERLVHGRYDVPCRYVVTPGGVKNCVQKGRRAPFQGPSGSE